ncbi:MAG: hypothetical protein LQ351_000570 [Letrouitia transgressa]|nr:MAG: hypothetical protein LQ351_000570 [Letrouitia transgressa]
MPPPSCAENDGLHWNNCLVTLSQSAPQPWEFLFYIPSPNHPISSDPGCPAHFALVLPPSYKPPSCRNRADYHAVALVTRNPRSLNTKGAGARYVTFRPHTARCLCGSAQQGQIETQVFNRLLCPTTTAPAVTIGGRIDADQGARHMYMHSSKANDYDQPCAKYGRQNAKGQFETWSWFKDSCIPLQAPKMVHVDSLHLMRPLTQRKFGLRVMEHDIRRLEASFSKFRSGSNGEERR